MFLDLSFSFKQLYNSLNTSQRWNFHLGVGEHNTVGTYTEGPHKFILSVKA